MNFPRIAIITPGTFPIPSGASSSVERVVEYTAGLAAAYVNATIYGKQWPDQQEHDCIKGVRYERVRAVNQRQYLQRVLRRVVADAPDIVQIENRPKSVLAIRKALPSAQVWLNLHSTSFVHPAHISARTLRQSIRLADRIFVNSRYLYEQIVRVSPQAAPRIVINPLGVDVDRFISRWTVEGARISSENKLIRGWEKRRIILFAGRLIPLKGVHHLLRAAPHVIKRHPDVLIVIVGSASYGRNRKTAYVRRLKRLGRLYPQHVRFVPYVPHEEMPVWYAMADIAVVPSVKREAFGLVNVEAMAAGVPVVAASVGGIREVIVDGVTGLLLPPRQLSSHLSKTLNELLADAVRLERMGRAGVQHVHTLFTWQHTADRWGKEAAAALRL